MKVETVDYLTIPTRAVAWYCDVLGLRVADVEDARRELEEKRIGLAGETVDSGVCHMAFLRDPDGNTVTLHRRYAPRGES
jgi:catechol 2,3-dioxygenase-like lactoylglutathione lyase family enzyme